MRVAIVSDLFLPHMGGLEVVVDRIATEYVKMGIDVAVFTFDTKYLNGDYKAPYKIYRTQYPSIKHRVASHKKILLQLEEFHPDIIHAHTQEILGFWASVFAKKNRIPFVSTVHTWTSYVKEKDSPFRNNTMFHKMYMRKRNHLPIMTCHNAKIITAVSFSASKNEVHDSYGEKRYIYVIRNGFDRDKIENIKEKIDIASGQVNRDSSKINMCFAGRLVEEKNLVFSLRVCKKLQNSNTPYSFSIAGDGTDVKTFKVLSQKLGVASNVRFTGRLDFNSLVRLYLNNDLLLFPSLFDCDSITGIESRLCGLPTLCIKGTGTSERVKNGINGFVLDNDIDSFTNKIKELFYLKRFKKNQFASLINSTKNERVETWEEVALKYYDIYNMLLEEKNRETISYG